MASAFHTSDANFYIDGIRRGDIAILGRAITLVESSREAHKKLAGDILQAFAGNSSGAFRLGITGVPGAGKSTFIENFGKVVLERGHKLAVLAIDPSSARSKGSILGDKTRMELLSATPGVFIRPSPSSGELGGVARATYETLLLCEAAGYDFIIIETVGVGQSETAVSRMCDFFLLLMLAGAGDELQGIKRGIMEMADMLAVNKADGNNVDKARAARADYAHAMHLLQPPDSGWTPRAVTCSGLTGSGVAEIYDAIAEYRQYTQANGYFFEKRKQQQLTLLRNAIDEHLRHRFYDHPGVAEKMQELSKKGYFLPYNESQKLLDFFFGKS